MEFWLHHFSNWGILLRLLRRLKGWLTAPIMRCSWGGGMKERTEMVGSGGIRRAGRITLLKSAILSLGDFAFL